MVRVHPTILLVLVEESFVLLPLFIGEIEAGDPWLCKDMGSSHFYPVLNIIPVSCYIAFNPSSSQCSD